MLFHFGAVDPIYLCYVIDNMTLLCIFILFYFIFLPYKQAWLFHNWPLLLHSYVHMPKAINRSREGDEIRLKMNINSMFDVRFLNM